MKIIPVIDLKHGVVVHAQQGQRESYRPMQSPLCSSSDIYRVIDAFLALYAFDTIYIADLDALMKQGNHDVLIHDVLVAFPKITFWLDQGYRPYNCRPNYMNSLPVLGSESYQDESLSEIGSFKGNFILSLDYKGDDALGAQRLFNDPALWPQDIIIMTLARVGSASGPDFKKLKRFCQRYPDKNFIAAGGVRGGDDLLALQTLGVTQALVASALHLGKLSADDIAVLQAKKYPDKSGYF